ncbi:hypothetical protein HAX54_020804 [Datura stramonium]|uniref:Uncharacterized protein n=1 Tax=Datura stramonium TaxID=4076 RepID=A0ABS8S3E1_DATST|nr:hypothetical protein [Datura stramonium]
MTLNSIKVEDSAMMPPMNMEQKASSSASMLPGEYIRYVCRLTGQHFRNSGIGCRIFFPDDPLHRFKNQTGLRRFVLGIEFFLPVLEWGPKYNVKLLGLILLLGVTIANLSIPQGISYAKLANCPLFLGYFKTFSGWSGIHSFTCDGNNDQPSSSIQQRANFISSNCFHSNPFFRINANGYGFLQQSLSLFATTERIAWDGPLHRSKMQEIVPVLTAVFSHRDEWTWQSVVMGVCFLMFLLTTRQISARN